MSKVIGARIQGGITMRPSTPIFLTLLLVMMPLSGCVSDGAQGIQGESGPMGPMGPMGQAGVNGTNGEDGANGTDGVDGSDGVDGVIGPVGPAGMEGNATLIDSFQLMPGPLCSHGGVGLHIGIDADRDGVLSMEEVSRTQHVCNGVDGGNATDPDMTGEPRMLREVRSMTTTDGCPAGGRTMMFGLDNGDGGGMAQNGILESGEVDDRTEYCGFHRVSMVNDTLPGDLGSGPRAFATMSLEVGSTVYFSADDGIHGREPWAYDVSTQRMWMVEDIEPGVNGSFPGALMGVVVGHAIYFDAWTSDLGRMLWAHDVVNDTTWQVTPMDDVQPPAMLYNPGDDLEIVIGDRIYFSAYTYEFATELWVHDTTNHTTSLIRDVHLGSSSNPGWLMSFQLEDRLYFSCRDNGNVHDLWALDLNTHATWKVHSFGSAPDTNPGLHMDHLVGSTLYFDAQIDPFGRELMAYGLENDTAWRVADLEPGLGSSDPGAHLSVVIDEVLYFDTADLSLWAHDPANGSTWRILRSHDRGPGEGFNEIVSMGVLYFTNDDGVHGNELWAYDPANASPWMVADLVPGTNGSDPGYGLALAHNERIYFSATTPETGRELWAHDPLDGSTWSIVDLASNEQYGANLSSHPGLLLSSMHQGVLLFDARSVEHGRELWMIRIEHTITYANE